MLLKRGGHVFFVLLLTAGVVMGWVQPYYINYESALAQLYAINLAPAEKAATAHITELSPLFLIGFTQVLAYLYDVYAGVAWYGVLMQGLMHLCRPWWQVWVSQFF